MHYIRQLFLNETYQQVNIRVQTLTIPQQSVITKDGVSITVDAVCFFRVVDIRKAVLSVQNYVTTIRHLSQYTLEVVIGEHTLEDLLQKREQITNRIFNVIKNQTLSWGIEIDGLEIKDVKMPDSLVRVMAIEAETMREGKAKVIVANAEREAAKAYAEAAEVLMSSEGAMQLRYLETLREIAAEKNSTILIPSTIAGLLK